MCVRLDAVCTLINPPRRPSERPVYPWRCDLSVHWYSHINTMCSSSQRGYLWAELPGCVICGGQFLWRRTAEVPAALQNRSGSGPGPGGTKSSGEEKQPAVNMKFTEHLLAHITPEWRKQYIQYEVRHNVDDSWTVCQVSCCCFHFTTICWAVCHRC